MDKSLIIIGYVICGAICGITTLFVMRDKGYDEKTANKWALAAFFFGFVPFIAACAKTNLNILNAIKNISSNNSSNNTEYSKNNTNNGNNNVKSTTISEKSTICCPECGAPNPIGTHFCEECGADLSKIN